MSNEFRKRIQQSINNQILQLALDANAQRRKAGRLSAFASLPDYQERRARAHAIKADVVAHLDQYLAQFIERAMANGIIVHRAADGDEAIRMFLEIAESDVSKRRQSASPDNKSRRAPILVAKSKSMVSEEINLNHALEAEGIRVVETDLGEYIVQLRGERPSHIITPAVHLRRQEVGQLFAEKLGIPYTEDVPTLTNTARQVLRDVFLTADVGVSGVNFGVAESGTLCVVTNEGNGRMVTTLPPIHIALMGIERLVPTLDDLALFLSLLPRSATGQKLSVYTSLINAPFPHQTRHLILLDNGRTALRHSSLVTSLYCIRCGACLNACPVFRELGGHAYGCIYPGPIGSVISGALVDLQFDYLAQASSLCGACREACPVDIDLPGLLLRVRAGEGIKHEDTKRNPSGIGLPASVKLGLKAFRFVAGIPGLFAVSQTLGGILSRVYSPRRAYMRIPAWTGWGYSKDFPRLAIRPFRARWGAVKQAIEETGDQGNKAEGDQANKRTEISESLVTQFISALTALEGKVSPVAEKDLVARLADFLKSKAIDRVYVDDVGAKYVANISLVRVPDPAIRCGVTGALCGIAESGSLVLVGGAGQTLTASLLPEIHVAILKASALFENLPQVLSLREVRAAPAAVLVTGPSRTGDIEMTHTIGVHGPGELHVFLIDDL